MPAGSGEIHKAGCKHRAATEVLRPPFAMDWLCKEGAALVYHCAKQHSEPGSDKRGIRVGELQLTPLELIDRIAALVPPPRTANHSPEHQTLVVNLAPGAVNRVFHAD